MLAFHASVSLEMQDKPARPLLLPIDNELLYVYINDKIHQHNLLDANKLMISTLDPSSVIEALPPQEAKQNSAEFP